MHMSNRDPNTNLEIGNSHLECQVWVSLVHLRVQGPNSMAQVHAGIKQHFDIEQIVYTWNTELL